MMRPPPRIAALAALSCATVALGCAEKPPYAGPPAVDRAAFEESVYPVLLRDCGFPACHGDSGRFFQVHGPNRTRLDPEATELDAPATAAEIQAAYERARSMLASVRSAEEALLLRKPLEVDEGGAPHMGIDDFGRDVYATPEAGGYQTLLAWGSERADEPAPTPEPVSDAGGDDAGLDDGGVDDALAPDAGGGA